MPVTPDKLGQCTCIYTKATIDRAVMQDTIESSCACRTKSHGILRAVPPGIAPRSRHRQLVIAQSAIPPVVRLASLLPVVTCVSKVSDPAGDFNVNFA